MEKLTYQASQNSHQQKRHIKVNKREILKKHKKECFQQLREIKGNKMLLKYV